MPTVLKSGNLNLLEPSGPVQACNGIAFLQLQLIYKLQHMITYKLIVIALLLVILQNKKENTIYLFCYNCSGFILFVLVFFGDK